MIVNGRSRRNAHLKWYDSCLVAHIGSCARELARSGFTLVEVAIVVALMGVLAAIAYGSTRDQMPRYRLIRAAKGLKSDLVNLKNLAVLTNRETRMVMVSSPGDCGDTEAYGGEWHLQVATAHGDRVAGNSSH